MASKSNSVDKTSTKTSTNVMDRRTVQQSGMQILDSVINSTDDKVVKAALGEITAMLDNIGSSNTVTVDRLLQSVEKVSGMVNKGQVDISNFGLQALEKARSELRNLSDKGEVIIKLADQTVGQAMTMAQKIANDQARNQNFALEILADTKTGDYQDTLKSVSGMVMGFVLLALLIIKKGK